MALKEARNFMCRKPPPGFARYFARKGSIVFLKTEFCESVRNEFASRIFDRKLNGMCHLDLSIRLNTANENRLTRIKNLGNLFSLNIM